MTAEEARTKLEAWRDLLKAKLEWTTEGPWRFDKRVGCVAVYEGPPINCIENEKENLIHYSERGVESDERAGTHAMPHSTAADAELIAFSRSAVPAMLAGIEGVLEMCDKDETLKLKKNKFESEVNDNWYKGGQAHTLIVFAEAYEPYFQEVQA
jgi:hypothetical protein